MDPSPVDPVAVHLRRRVAVPPVRSLSVHRGHTRREYPGSRIRSRHHCEAGRGGSTPSPVPVAWPTLEIRPWRSRRSWPWLPDERSPAWRVAAWFASVTAIWTGDVPTQPAVAVELMEASGDRDSTDGRDGTLDSIVPDGAPALRSRGGGQRPESRRRAAGTRAAARVARLGPLRLRNVRLSTPKDGRYSPTLRQLVPSGGGSPATRVGWELDRTLRIHLRERLLAGARYPHLVPARVLRERTPGGAGRYPRLRVVADV